MNARLNVDEQSLSPTYAAGYERRQRHQSLDPDTIFHLMQQEFARYHEVHIQGGLVNKELGFLTIGTLHGMATAAGTHEACMYEGACMEAIMAHLKIKP